VLLSVVLSVVVVACSDDDALTTTTVSPTETTVLVTTTTTEAVRRLEYSGPPFIREGDRGAWVEALQWYVVCTGHHRLYEDGPEVGVDGVYGPMTADGVAYFQADLGRIPTGEPDEETFALMAQACDTTRVIEIPVSGGETEVAGSAAPGDDDVVTFEAGAGRVVEVVVLDGNVEVALEQPGGGVIRTITPGSGWSARLPESGTYTLRATADDTQSYRLRLRVGG
jgi:peptidoglycan hydrolase-like protein with peptidoglycan-binding domain